MRRPVPFAFKAVRRDGGLETGVVEAPSREAAAALIGSRGAFAIELSAKPDDSLRLRRRNPDDLAAGLRALATLLGSGVPLGRALSLLDELAPPSWLGALPDLRRRIEQGDRLATALDASPLGFPAHVIGIIQAGEAGSGLDAAVQSAAEVLEARAAARTALRNALAYPAMLAVAGGASVALLVAVVLPRFAGLLGDSGQTLPVTTRVVLGLGALSHVLFFPAIALVIAAAAAWRAWTARPAGLAQWHRLLLSVPTVGLIRRSTAAANACAALAALLDAGVPVAQALPHAARATGDRAMDAKVLAARGRIATGERISTALEKEDALTPTVVRLVRIGEETGRLKGMLAHAARIEASQALQRLQRGLRLLEPALILVFGGIVMLVAAALLQAMYGLRPAF